MAFTDPNVLPEMATMCDEPGVPASEKKADKTGDVGLNTADTAIVVISDVSASWPLISPSEQCHVLPN